jgi:hypothetical protein
MEEIQTSDEFKDAEPNSNNPKSFVLSIQRCEIAAEFTEFVPFDIPERVVQIFVNEKEMEKKIDEILQLLGE